MNFVRQLSGSPVVDFSDSAVLVDCVFETIKNLIALFLFQTGLQDEDHFVLIHAFHLPLDFAPLSNGAEIATEREPATPALPTYYTKIH